MKSSLIISLIKERHALGIQRPVYVVGSTGLGKTQLASQAAAELGIAFRVLHAPLMQPEDYGFPVIAAGKDDVSFLVSKAKFPLEGTECPEHGILLIDELPQADASGQKILANLILAREIHGQRLKAGWSIVATGNRSTDRAGANRLLSHLADRVTFVQFDASISDWSQWALKAGLPLELISFLEFRPDLLSTFDAQADKSATPRAWSQGIAPMIGKLKPEIEFETFKGDVGEGPAAEFCKYLKICRTLPNPDLIILNPDAQEVPTDVATLYATCGMLASKTSPENFGRIMSYVKRMPPEFSVLYVKQATGKNKKIAESKDFKVWASGDGAKLLV